MVYIGPSLTMLSYSLGFIYHVFINPPLPCSAGILLPDVSSFGSSWFLAWPCIFTSKFALPIKCRL